MKLARGHPHPSPKPNPNAAVTAVERPENTSDDSDLKEQQDEKKKTEHEDQVKAATIPLAREDDRKGSNPPAQTDWKDEPQLLASVGSILSNPDDPVFKKYNAATVAALAPKDPIQAIVATHLTVANTMALKQAVVMNNSEFLHEAEYHQRSYAELSRLTLELSNAYIQIQNNTQINQINIERVSFEKGAQAVAHKWPHSPKASTWGWQRQQKSCFATYGCSLETQTRCRVM
jgi:hypothetical protein